MKNIQNNFTTPEQSKRLLEFGVPADSADFYYDKDEVEIDEIIHPYILPFNRKFSNYNDMFYLPCWSVGRLIEIYLTCALECHPYDDFYTETQSLHFIASDKDRLIDEIIEIMFDDTMDFTKLED